MNHKDSVLKNVSDDSLLHTLFLGDCREILSCLKPNRIHLVLTSPPYNLNTPYDQYEDNLSNPAYFTFTTEWVKGCFRVLMPGGRIAINCPLSTKGFGNCFFPHLYAILEDVGFCDVATFVWVKRFADSGRLIYPQKVYGSIASPKAPHVRDACELILVMQKPGGNFPITHPPDLTQAEYAAWTVNVWDLEPEANRSDHPAPFPLALPTRLIKLFTVPGQFVLDPFIGSGTTLQAADQLSRRCLGCDVSRKYLEIAIKRVGADTVQLRTLEDLISTGLVVEG
jgi:site-specific DNA-methyltransferase (adenine-specific)